MHIIVIYYSLLHSGKFGEIQALGFKEKSLVTAVDHDTREWERTRTRNDYQSYIYAYAAHYFPARLDRLQPMLRFTSTLILNSEGT